MSRTLFENVAVGITKKEAEDRFRDSQPSLRNAILDLDEISKEAPFHVFNVSMITKRE